MSQKVNLWNFGVGSYIQKEQDEKCSLAKNQSVDANERGDVTSILEQKSVENFALSYPQNAYLAGWYRYGPFSRPTLVKVV